MNHNDRHPQNPVPAMNRHRQRKNSRFEQWLYRVRHSRREKRRFIQMVVVIAAVLLAFIIGYFYFGPSFTFSGGS